MNESQIESIGDPQPVTQNRTCGECAGYGKCDGYVRPDNPAPFCFSPVTPPETLPEYGWFDGAADDMFKRQGVTDMEANIINDLTSAHSRDMEAARARIAVLELDFSQAKENAETNARLLNEALTRIAALEAEVKHLQAEPIEKHKGGSK